MSSRSKASQGSHIEVKVRTAVKPLHGEKGSLISLWNTHWRSSEIARNGNKNSCLVQEPEQPRTRRWPLLSEDENRKWITVMLKTPNTTQLPWWLPAAPKPWASEPISSLLPTPVAVPAWLGSWGPARSPRQSRASHGDTAARHWLSSRAWPREGRENPLGGENSWETQSSARPSKALSMPCIGRELSMPLLEAAYRKDAKNCRFFCSSTQAVTVLTRMRGVLSPGTVSLPCSKPGLHLMILLQIISTSIRKHHFRTCLSSHLRRR